MYAVIMAGGGGTRLWPLSLPDRPKPFLPLLGTDSLLQRTVARLLEGPELEGVLEPSGIAVVTERRYASLVNSQLPGVRVLAEPRGRNTAAAVALATLSIDRPDNEVMLVLPADHTIADDGVYRAVLRDAHGELAQGALGVDDPLVTLGVEVKRAATEYGYLIPDLNRSQMGNVSGYVLKAFEEKPTSVRASALQNEMGVAWNAGIFMWRRRAIRAALEKYAGGLLATLESSILSPGLLEGAYERTQPISIDYAVMEGAAKDGKVLMGSMNVGWSDLGTWASLLDALVGGYARAARVVPPGEDVALGEGDLLVRRDSGRLVLDAGPAGTMRSDQPMGLLPEAAPHRAAIDELIGRIDRVEGRA
jgi:mannose-1-phosphate guanylyltransferase